MASGRVIARRKAIEFLKTRFNNRNIIRDTFGKSTASQIELVRVLHDAGEITRTSRNTRTCGKILIAWAESRPDLDAPVPASVKRGKKKSPEIKTHNDRAFAKTDKFLSSWEWRTLRYKVLMEHGRRCMCCGATPDDGVTVICVDHIKPRHTHPEMALDRDNLQVLCGVCNQGKGAWDQTDHRGNVVEYDFQSKLAHDAKERQ